MKKQNAMQLLDIDGVRVLYIKNESFLTTIQVLTNVGSAVEEPEVHGMAHILEHMFFKGSEKRPGGTTISRAANDIGGKLNAYTSYDHTVYYITVLNDKFETGADILFDMYLNPLFPSDEFSKELKPILSELRERDDDPDSFLMERILENYMGAGYHSIIGQEESIRAATVEKMHQFKNRYYGGQNCLISIVGGIERDEVERIIRSKFKFNAKTEKPAENKVEYKPGSISLTRPGINEAYYYLFYPALSFGHPDRYKQDLMCYILGGNDSALLFERIREELGMSCYGIYSWIMRYEPYSVLGVTAGIAPEELDQMDSEVRQQIKRLCDSPVDEQFLSRAKASIRTSIAARSETSSGLSSLVALPVLKGETEHPVEKALSEIEKITTKDIMEFANQTFSAEPMKGVLLPE